MAFMWQYQILAELPPANRETGGWEPRIGPDMWLPKLPDIYFRARYLSKAIIPQISTAPIISVWAERMTPDKWSPSLPARRYERVYLTAAVLSYPTYTEEPWRHREQSALTFIMEKTKTHF